MPFKNELVEITTQLVVDPFFYNPTQVIFPIKLNSEQSALALEIIPDTSESDLKNQVLTAVVFRTHIMNYSKRFLQTITINKICTSRTSSFPPYLQITSIL